MITTSISKTKIKNQILITTFSTNLKSAFNESSKNSIKINPMKHLSKRKSAQVVFKNLPFAISTDKDKFYSMASKAGHVCYYKLTQTNDDIFGVVIYNNYVEANRAIDIYNNKLYDGRKLLVIKNESLTFSDRSPEDFGLNAILTNLSYDITEKQIIDHLNKYANVKHVEIILNRGGYSTGTALVTFLTPLDTKNAILNAHNTMLHTRLLEINQSNSNGSIKDDGFIHNNIDSYFHDNIENSGLKAFIGNLTYNLTNDELFNHLKKYSNVKEVNILFDRDGRSKGCAIATFKSPEDTKIAIIKAHDSQLDGRLMKIRLDREESY